MEENLRRKTIWDAAGRSGLVLGLLLCATLFAGSFISCSSLSDVAKSGIGMILSFVRIGGFIFILALLMRLFNTSHPELERRDCFRFGRAAAISSGLIYGAAGLLDSAYIHHDLYVELYTLTLDMSTSVAGPDKAGTTELIMNNIPEFTFFSYFLNTAFWGTVLAYILYRRVPRQPKNNELE